MKLVVVIMFCLSLICFHNSSTAEDAIKPNQSLLDGGKILVSNGENFELGFFSPPNSNNRYVGIWFKNIAELTTVWVANRDNPITDSSGVLKITETGNIVILSNKTETLIWSSNSSAKDPTLQLLNTGNLVLKDGNSGSYAWQSFDHPCDSFIAGMKLGWDFTTGQTWNLTSWKSLQDPSIGIYTYEHDPGGLPQVLLRKGQDILYRNGPWDGVGDASVRDQSFFLPSYDINETQRYYTFKNGDNSTITRFWLNPLGSADQLRWNYASNSWVTIFAAQKEDCDTFARCGPNGICDSSYNGFCHCPDGFVQKDPEAWAAMNLSAGCVLKTRLNCSASEGFKKFSRLKLPYGSNFTVNNSVVRKEECEVICRKSCSCVAYAVARVGGCVVWAGDMLDMRLLRDGGQDLHIRMAASELGNGKGTSVIISVSVVSGFVLLFLVGGYLIIRKRRTSSPHIRHENTLIKSHEDQDPSPLEDDVELPSFDLDTIANATDNFSPTNKIGEGGFGTVYKGMLSTGQEIAVKRLSKNSGQGLTEFKNEVILIAKLQHRNLEVVGMLCSRRREDADL